jgi:hypothetical protein
MQVPSLVSLGGVAQVPLRNFTETRGEEGEEHGKKEMERRSPAPKAFHSCLHHWLGLMS